MRIRLSPVLPLLLTAFVPAQVLPGDIGITGFSTTSFAVASPPPTVTTYNAGTFMGTGGATSQAILHDPVNPNDFIVGGFGFVGRATITGPGTVVYSLITNGINTASQMSWDNSGNIIVADAGTDQVRLVTTGGTVTDLSTGTQPWGTSVNAGAFERSTGDVIVGGSGGLFRLPNGQTTGVPIVTGLGGFVSGVTFDPCNGDILATVLTLSRLVRVTSLGVVTDEIPAATVGAPNSLDIDENGNYIIGGANGQVFRSPPGGPATLIATATGLGTSASGVAYVSGNRCPYGAPCPAPFGLPTLTTVGAYTAGFPLVTKSINHNPGVLGLAVFSLSQIMPPLNLGPIFGTNGCFLHVAPDFIDVGITNATGEFVHAQATNLTFANQRLYVQHAVLEGVPLSSFTFSNGLCVQF
ncbi:MAG: hypothetical protein ABIP94_08445 [Planctomycetota bacterium]